MEEASVAGESPDRSKQHESSEEPTSGSAGPVPEARTEASERRDPRLTVARERSAGAGAGSRGGVDTATRVLSVRETGAEASGGEDGDGTSGAAGASSDPSASPEQSDAAEGADAGPAAGNDGRLRDAVAAWVATADERAAANARLEDAEEPARDATDGERAATAAHTEDDGPAAPGKFGPAAPDTRPSSQDADSTEQTPGPPADSDTDTTTAPGADTGSASDAGSAPGAGADSSTGPGTDPATGSDTGSASDTGADAGSAPDAGSDSSTGPGTGSGTGTGTAADTDPDAASASGPGTGSAPDAGADSSTGSGTGTAANTGLDTDAATAPGSGAGEVSGSSPDGGSGSSGVAGSPAAAAGPGSGEGEGADDTPSGANAAPEAASAAAPVSDADPEPTADARSEASADTAPEASADAHSEAGTDAAPEEGAGTGPKAGADTAPKAGTDTGPKPGADTGPEEGAGTAPKSSADTDPKPGADTGPEAGAGPDAESRAEGPSRRAGGDDREPPVDQPTAVFKAPRISERGVDQPTTMLKIGDAAAAAKKDAKDAKGGQDGDAERTSKFVALRSPDDPATRKPPRARETPGAPGTQDASGASAAPGAPQGQTPPAGAPKASQAPRTGVTAARSHVGPDRTTQQPLPPKPPLDLLAELTNTPPPPETPLRTTVRRVKIWTPLVVLLLIVFGVVQAMRPLPAPTLDLTAQDSFTFDGGKPEIPWPSSGQAALDVQGIGTFGSSGDQKPVPIASVAKVMTAYVILRDHSLKSGAEGPKIKIDQAAEEQSEAGDESTVHVYEGDSISQREALESILIASANNVARLLARWDAGSEKAFVEKMNAAAKDLGMTNTTYTDPSGLNNTTVSTAVDQVKLAKEAMKEPAFREVAAMMSYDDYKGVNHSNWNHLVGHNDVVGIKTGTTTSALGNLVFAAKKEVGGETRTIVGAVVRQPAGGADNTILGAALDSSDKLIRAAQDTLKSSTILKKGTVVGYVDDGLGGRTPVVATQDVKAVGWAGLTVKLTFDADEVPHTAQAGTKVGTLTVGDGGTSGAVKVPVALRDDLVEPGLSDKLTRLG
ncbi:D-alanyl-D-alanine carboxypeptidase [Streptomyces sp. enrichment culture]|uniref:D-alanyl-D-alanine carboxypeptidase n=1 Tax=Streptomyces sp. enrichment culture TaxID=1795815 RepID=UPI003F56DDB1